jgi:DNA invertase Pin-like site-specific DNA recombinase
MASIAEFERALIHQRTGAGRAATPRGVRFGRPPKLTAEQVVVARRLIDEGTLERSCRHALSRAWDRGARRSARPAAEGPRMSRWEHRYLGQQRFPEVHALPCMA